MNSRRLQLFLGSLLVVGVALVYWPLHGFNFINFDDPVYVTSNPQVRAGLTWEGLKWAWHTTETANWHPVTWLSHMVDWQLFGPRAGWHHAVNVLLHAANAVLVFLLLTRLTARIWPAFCVAALFAWHPLHVESVAWISERKDVLSSFFGLFAILAYVRFVKNEKAPARKKYYLLTCVLFSLSLMSKPMLVTLPFLLLLLDYWPLQRRGWRSLVVEKIPLFLLSAVSCGLTLWAQRAQGAVVSAALLPVPVRLANAVWAYFWYLAKLVWPTNLAIYYPYANPPATGAVWMVALAFIVSILVVLRLRRCLYLTTGWLWFLGMLVPVIGFVQVGSQAMADRYSYLPSVGLFIAIVFGLADLWSRFQSLRFILMTVAGAALVGCVLVCSRQVQFWRNSETLYRHAVAVTSGNFAAYNNLGFALQTEGKLAEAVECYKKALEFHPNYAVAHANLGNCYLQLKQPSEAKTEFLASIALDASNPAVHSYFGSLLLNEGNITGAIEQFRIAISLVPQSSDFHYRLATALMQAGQIDESQREYRECLRYNPNRLEALNNLAWSLATDADSRWRNGAEAVQLAERAVALTHSANAGILDTLGVAYAEAGHFQDAAKAVSRAVEIARGQLNMRLADEIEKRLQLYEKSQPFRDSATAPVK